MSDDASPRDEAIHEVFPYLRIRGAADAIAFYRDAFGAKEIFRLTEPGGRIGHAELQLGPIVLMLSEEFPEYGIEGPLAYGGTGTAIHLHVGDADAVAKRVVDAGGTMLMEPTDQFYGERACRVRDPFGHEWLIGHEIEKVTPQEMQRRYEAMFQEE